MVMLFVLVAIGMAITMGNEIIGKAQATSHIQEAESTMKHVRDYIYQVASEGNGSSRALSLNVKDGYFEADVPKNTISYHINGFGVLDYLSRKYENGIYTISGNDVRCWKDDDYLYMENSEIQVKLIRNGTSENWVPITNDIIKNITRVDTGNNFNITNSSILIDGELSSTSGNGYTELLQEETSLPFCRAHLFINSSFSEYEVFYTLFSGADFFVQEIRGPLTSKTITTFYEGIIDGGVNDLRVNDTIYKSNQTIDQTYFPEKKYISSQYGGVIFGMFFTGSHFDNISLNSGLGYHPEFRINQNYDKNRVIVAFSKGTWEDFDEKISEINTYGISLTKMGNNPTSTQQKFRTSVSLILDGVNLTGRIRWGSGSYELFIRNLGKSGNTTIIELELR